MEISQQYQIYLIAFLVAIAVIAGAFALFGKRIKSQETKSSRVQTVSGSADKKVMRAAENSDPSIQRRKAVQKQLKQLEDQQKAKKQRLTIQMRIDRAGLTISPQYLLMISMGMGVLAGGILFLTGYNPYIALSTTITIGLGLPRLALNFLGNRRIKKFSNEFVNAIDIIVRGIKSGLPVNDCLKIIAQETSSPVKEEFGTIVAGQKMGVTLAQSLEKLHQRIPTSEVNFFGIVIAIQQQTGGNLAEALANLSIVLRDRKKMKGKIQAMSSEAKSSATIIGSLPFIVAVLVNLSTPDYLTPLFEERAGNMMLIGSAIWMSMGVVVMRKMINFKI